LRGISYGELSLFETYEVAKMIFIKTDILSLKLYLAKLDILKIESFRLGKISEIAQNAGRILLLHSLSYCYYRLIGNI